MLGTGFSSLDSRENANYVREYVLLADAEDSWVTTRKVALGFRVEDFGRRVLGLGLRNSKP